MRAVTLVLGLWTSRALSHACGRVHFVGNSVSRGWAFALSALVNVGSHYVFSNVSDFALRAAIEGSSLRKAMKKAPAVPNVWFRTSTRACDDVYGLGVEEVNAKLRIVNRVVMRELAGSGARVFDAWTNQTSCSDYDDRVHSRALIQAQLSAWTRVACSTAAGRYT
jgi:hypothetical protein